MVVQDWSSSGLLRLSPYFSLNSPIPPQPDTPVLGEAPLGEIRSVNSGEIYRAPEISAMHLNGRSHSGNYTSHQQFGPDTGIVPEGIQVW